MTLWTRIRESARLLRGMLAVCLAASLAAILMIHEQELSSARERELYAVNSLLWKVSELIYESERLNSRLIAYQNGDAGKGDVEQRFDILWSRANVLSAAGIARKPIYATVVSHYFNFLQSREDDIFTGREIAPPVIDSLRSELGALTQKTRALWSAAMAEDETGLVDGERHTGSSSLDYRLFAMILIISLILFVVLELFLANRDRDREKRLHIEAAAASAEKSRFLANVSHEIRTPLNGILGMASELSETELTKDQSDCLKVIEQSGGVLLSTLNDVLDLSKVEAGQFHIEIRPFVLSDVLEAAVSLYAAQAREKGLDLSLRIQENLPRVVMGDGRRLRQVLHNLIANAVKFTEKGSVTLLAQPCGDGQSLVISVRDTGTGIEREAREKIFEPFSQADPSVTRQHGGTGLGLTISRQLCEAMNGTLTMTSRVGRGSSFFCEMPLVAAPQDAVEGLTKASAAPPKLNGRRIMVVDDNSTNRLILGRFLAPTSAAVHMAVNGAEAFEVASSEPFDVIFMDIQMPRMDGVAATKAIRDYEAESGQTAVPIIGVTANALPHQIEAYLAAGMNQVLAKPVSKKALMALLCELFEVSKAA